MVYSGIKKMSRNIFSCCVKRGLTMAYLWLYTNDVHGIRSRREPETVEGQLEGIRRPTQFGRLIEELGITSITARSPQARGRIERL